MTSTIQFILAFLMLYHALPKILFSKNKLKTRGGKEMEYVDDLSQNNLKLIGIMELLTSLGIIIPEIINKYLWIINISSITGIIIMIGAIYIHIKRNDGIKSIIINILYIFMSVMIIFNN